MLEGFCGFIMLKAVIFDMDGVLVDSVKYTWESFNIMLKDEGVHFSNEDIKKNMGTSLKNALKSWRDEYGIKEYDPDEFSRASGKIQLALMEKNLQPNTHLHDFLKALKSQGFKLAVATSSLRWRAEAMLQLLHLTDYFDVILTAEDVTNHKPAPDVFLKAAEQLGVDPANSVVFEDAGHGIEAARKGNIKVVAVKTDYYTMEELEDADMIINDFSEITIEKLQGLF